MILSRLALLVTSLRKKWNLVSLIILGLLEAQVLQPGRSILKRFPSYHSHRIYIFSKYEVLCSLCYPFSIGIVFIFQKGSPGAAVRLLPCDHEVMDSSPKNSLLQKCRKGCVHKTQSGRILHKRELRAPGCPLLFS
jgi:hypothetical protein